MPESGLSGSVRGVPSNGHPYRDLKYTACSEKHICDHTKIWIRRSSIYVRALRLHANRKPNPLNLNFA